MNQHNLIIDNSAKIIDSHIGENTSIWKNVFVKNVSTGKNVSIGDFSRIENSQLDDYVNIQRFGMIYNSNFGRYSYTGRNITCWFSEIGKFCSISWNVSIGGANHDYNRVTTSAFLYSDIFDLKQGNKGYERFHDSCVIGNDVWIGCGAVICRNVKIGDGAVIGANSVVTRDVEPYSIVVGSPAKHIKYRFSSNIINKLLEIRWWELPAEIIKKNYNLFNTIPSEDTLSALEALINDK